MKRSSRLVQGKEREIRGKGEGEEKKTLQLSLRRGGKREYQSISGPHNVRSCEAARKDEGNAESRRDMSG